VQLGEEPLCAQRAGNAEFPKHPAPAVDACRAGGHPLRAHAVQCHDRLLRFALDGDAVDSGAAVRLEDRLAVGAIGLVAPAVRCDIMGRDQLHLETEADQQPRPVVGAGAAFHNHAAGLACAPEALELVPGHPAALLDAPRGRGDGDLEDVLGDVDGDGYVGHGTGSFRHRFVIGVLYQG
jgi:hypothetical protein